MQRIKASLADFPRIENFDNPVRFKVRFDTIEVYEEHVEYCQKLTKVFSDQDWFLSVRFTFHETPQGLICKVKLQDDESNVLRTLRHLMEDLMYATVQILTKNSPKHASGSDDYYCSNGIVLTEESLANCEGEIETKFLTLSQISTFAPWELTVILCLDPCPLSELTLPSLPIAKNNFPEQLSVCKKILQEEIASDAIIISSNGIPVKCHKNFLFAHSAVFTTMFQSAYQEGQTNSVELVDMSEDGVRALLAYLYYWDQTAANDKSTVAFELLNAGHKYDIDGLEEKMAGILLSKKISWFDLDVAVKLFAFARNLPSNKGNTLSNKLKEKAVLVMKENLDQLEQCTSYQDIFKESPQAAMELCRCAFSS